MDRLRDDKIVSYRPYITTKDGRKIWAKWFGKKAFRIDVLPGSHTII